MPFQSVIEDGGDKGVEDDMEIAIGNDTDTGADGDAGLRTFAWPHFPSAAACFPESCNVPNPMAIIVS
jgi:hypothetical protein